MEKVKEVESKNSPSRIPNSVEEEEETDTSEDISKIPELPENEKRICRKIKIINIDRKKKRGYVVKSNRKDIRKKIIEVEYCKARVKLKKHYVSYLQRYLKWIRIELDKLNAKMSYRVVENDVNNEKTLSYGKLMMRRGELMTIRGSSQSERDAGTKEDTCGARGQSATLVTRSLATVVGQPPCVANPVTRNKRKGAKVVMEARINELIEIYKKKCERQDVQKRYRDRILQLERMIESIPEADEIEEEQERRIKRKMEELQQQHNLRDNADKLFQMENNAFTDEGEISASINSMISIHTVPKLWNIDKDAMLLSYLVKGNKMRLQVRRMGDIDVEAIYEMQIAMPSQATTSRTEEARAQATEEKNSKEGERRPEAKKKPKISDMKMSIRQYSQR